MISLEECPAPEPKCGGNQRMCAKGGHEWCMDMKDKGKINSFIVSRNPRLSLSYS